MVTKISPFFCFMKLNLKIALKFFIRRIFLRKLKKLGPIKIDLNNCISATNAALKQHLRAVEFDILK